MSEEKLTYEEAKRVRVLRKKLNKAVSERPTGKLLNLQYLAKVGGVSPTSVSVYDVLAWADKIEKALEEELKEA